MGYRIDATTAFRYVSNIAPQAIRLVDSACTDPYTRLLASQAGVDGYLSLR